MRKLKRVKSFRKTIYINGVRWQIRTKFCLRDADGNSCLGLCDGTNKIIHLESDMPADEFVETLIHEYLHAVWFGTGMDDEGVPSWVEHWIVNQVAKGMVLNASFFASLFRTL
jgi:hypothetical protein